MCDIAGVVIYALAFCLFILVSIAFYVEGKRNRLRKMELFGTTSTSKIARIMAEKEIERILKNGQQIT